MKRIVCYGDSNTYGYDARDVFGGRLPSEERWTELLAAELGCDVINCGMNGRMVPAYPRSQELDLRLILRCAPCDLVIVMLGSNDVLTEREAEDTALYLRRFLSQVRQQLPKTNILLLAPPSVSGAAAGYQGALEDLAEQYESLAEEEAYFFANPQNWQIDLAHDGVHFSPEGHRAFARALETVIRELF